MRKSLNKTMFRLAFSIFVCPFVCRLPAERLARDGFRHIRLAFTEDHAPQPSIGTKTRKSLITGLLDGGNKLIKAVTLNKIAEHRQALHGNDSTPIVRRHHTEPLSLDCRTRSSRIPVTTRPRVCWPLPASLWLLRRNIWLPVKPKPA